jgi:hypothetical protein
MIIPFTILLQPNPDAPNSSKRRRIVEELWKNCRRIEEIFSDERAQNLSSILPQFFPAGLPEEGGLAKSFYNFSTILPPNSLL